MPLYRQRVVERADDGSERVRWRYGERRPRVSRAPVVELPPQPAPAPRKPPPPPPQPAAPPVAAPAIPAPPLPPEPAAAPDTTDTTREALMAELTEQMRAFGDRLTALEQDHRALADELEQRPTAATVDERVAGAANAAVRATEAIGAAQTEIARIAETVARIEQHDARQDERLQNLEARVAVHAKTAVEHAEKLDRVWGALAALSLSAEHLAGDA